MSSIPARPTAVPRPVRPSPAWEIAYLFPPQGLWTEQEYLSLSGNRLVEFSDGHIEVLPMPTMAHQLMVMFLSDLLRAFAQRGSAGTTLIAPFRVRLRPGRFREPDIMFMKTTNAARMGNEYWDGADLVVEIVSDDDRRRDLEVKRFEYAEAGIPEYWIVDPQRGEVTVLKLLADRYDVAGVYTPGQQAHSLLLPGFSVDVGALLAAGQQAS